jgi:8-oxo-dGTP pyrophosphatase MutT (NUDIX family)
MKECNAVKALIENKGKFLIVCSKDFIGGRWEIPGGRKKESESDDEALKREVFEETGLYIDIKSLVHSWSLTIPEKEIKIVGKTYYAKTEGSNVILGEEQSSYKWIMIEEFDKISIPAWLKESVKIFHKI